MSGMKLNDKTRYCELVQFLMSSFSKSAQAYEMVVHKSFFLRVWSHNLHFSNTFCRCWKSFS